MMVNTQCPRCSHPFQTEIMPGPAVMVRCPKCTHPFRMQGDQIIDPNLQAVQGQPSKLADDEVWEFEVERTGRTLESQPDLYATGTTTSPEAETVGPAGTAQSPFKVGPAGTDPLLRRIPQNKREWAAAEEIMATSEKPLIKGLATASPVIEKLTGLSNTTAWDGASDFGEDVPELPELDFQVQEVNQENESSMELKAANSRLRSPSSASFEIDTEFASMEFDEPISGSSYDSIPAYEDNVDDLLQSLVDGDDNEIRRFYIQRNNKEYGPFSEEEVHDLLSQRRLNGDDLARLLNGKMWKKLRDWYDFRAEIELLEKVKVRVGWEKSQRNDPEIKAKLQAERQRVGEQASASQDHLQATSSDSEPPEIAEVVRTEESAVAAPSNKASAKSKLKPVLALLVLALCGGLAYVFLLPPDDGGFGQKRRTRKRNRAKGILAKDNIRTYQRIRQNLLRLARTQTTSPRLREVRYLYFMLDTYGHDPVLLDDTRRVFQRYKALPPTQRETQEFKRIKVLRVLALKAPTKLKLTLKQAASLLPPTHKEWGYVYGRVLERTQRNSQKAIKHYEAFLKRFRYHTPARMRLVHLHRQQKQDDVALRLLSHVLRQAPKYMPALIETLALLLEAQRASQKRYTTLYKRAQKTFAKDNYPSTLQAKWYLLEAEDLWRRRSFDQALLRIERAVKRDTTQRPIRFRRIRYYLLDQQYKLVQNLLQKESKPLRDNHPKLLLWQFQVALQLREPLPQQVLTQINQSSKQNPALRYVYEYCRGLMALQQNKPKRAIQAFKRSLRQLNPFQRPYAQMGLAKLYLDSKQLDIAAQILTPLQAQRHPRSDVAQLWGRLMLAQKRYDQALKHAKMMQRQFSYQPEGYILAAQVYTRQQKYKPALALTKQALKLYRKTEPDLLLKRSDLQYHNKQYKEARKGYFTYRQAMKGQVDCSYWYRYGRTLLALSECAQVITSNLTSCQDNDSLLVLGRCAMRQKLYKRARRSYRLYRKRNPRKIEPYLALAQIALHTRRTRKAVQFYKVALQLDPKQLDATLALIQLYNKRKQKKRALKMLEQALTHYPNNLSLLLQQAQMLTEAEQWDKAAKIYQALIEKSLPKTKRSQLLAAYGQHHVIRGNLKQGTQLYKQAIAANAKAYDLYITLARLYIRQKQYLPCRSLLKRYKRKVGERDPNTAAYQELSERCRGDGD